MSDYEMIATVLPGRRKAPTSVEDSREADSAVAYLRRGLQAAGQAVMIITLAFTIHIGNHK